MSNKDETIEDLKKQLQVQLDKNQYLHKRVESLKKSTTVEIQTGSFEKKIIRRGSKKRQKLVRRGKNPEKLSLGFLGIIEFFCYPYSSFEKIFIRIGHQVGTIDKYDLPKLFNIYNKSKWFTEHGKRVVTGRIESESPLASEIAKAYDAGVKRMSDNDRKIKDREDEELLLRLKYMKPLIREKWLSDDPELRKEYDLFIKRKEREKRKSKKGG